MLPPDVIAWARAQTAALSAEEKALILAVAATLIAALTDKSLDAGDDDPEADLLIKCGSATRTRRPAARSRPRSR